MRIIAFYLPQFHCFEENDRWWGKGFTEWTNIRKAVPLFEGHTQPRVPLNNNYYNLLEDNVMQWQSEMAKQYGIYGFCYYHYWFGGKLLMEKPMENMLKNSNITLPFCISWANENWTQAWVNKSRKVLISQTYGSRDDWEKHYNYLRQFFLDKRYIKEGGKPLFIIYRPELIPVLREMLEFWNELAMKDGFKGICFAYQFKNYNHKKSKEGDLFQYGIEYQPVFSRKDYKKTVGFVNQYFRNFVADLFKRPTKIENTICFDYDKEWQNIIKTKPRDEKMIPGAFVDWDNTPRHKNRGSVYLNVTPEKFEKYLTIQIKRTKEIYHKDILFLFAWNEWGEGGYLEPDEKYQYRMLEAVRNALAKNEEGKKEL